MDQHLAWSMHLGICSHAAGICSHTALVVHTLLVIDAFPSLKHLCPALGTWHDRLPSRSSRSLSNGEIRSHFGDCCAFLQLLHLESIAMTTMVGILACAEPMNGANGAIEAERNHNGAEAHSKTVWNGSQNQVNLHLFWLHWLHWLHWPHKWSQGEVEVWVWHQGHVETH